ncbi:tripartite tricarboxylate transporter TctB family protein [Pontibacillus marinus]|uniref:Uncharacterized protein n=1 Tax=Pontibacillus marinus BH030004 = DSM 16465 TaxID=1385511 RepID=A0A0A5GEF3_9BACI|nr:tripartite tricarboxylate transporter TctB family protein [Pontibacillus marinus]KGX89593.1 hypothetical protein N783_05570 [Pontibacillus marinus BH030004 = DSM 16465]
MVTYVVGALAVGLLALFLSMYIQNKKIIISILTGIVLAAILFVLFEVYQETYPSFSEISSLQFNEDTEFEVANLSIYEFSEGEMPERQAMLKIKDQAIIDRILSDFKNMKFKKDEHAERHFRKYHLTVTVTKKVKKDHFTSETFTYDFDEDYLFNYEILNETNHMQTIKSLRENDDLNWNYYDNE